MGESDDAIRAARGRPLTPPARSLEDALAAHRGEPEHEKTDEQSVSFDGGARPGPPPAPASWAEVLQQEYLRRRAQRISRPIHFGDGDGRAA